MSFAIVPACGHSTRMGRPKLSLPLGDRTVIESVVSNLLDGGVSRVLVVVGPHVPELVPLATEAGAEVLALSEPTNDMRKSVERGLARIEELYHPKPADWWFLTPADHPGFGTDVVRRLLNNSRDVTYSIVVPVHAARRGHPLLLRWRHVEGIRSLLEGEGINTYLKRLESEIHEVPIDYPGILIDLDTPDDYKRLLRDADE